MHSRWTWAALLLAAVVLGASLYSHTVRFLDTQIIRSNEIQTLVNVPIELALHGKFHYPLIEGELWTGTQQFALHPPLFYYLAGQFLKAAGVGRWQIQFPAFLASMAIAVAVCFAGYRLYGAAAAIAAGFLSLSFYGLTYAWELGRADVLLGLVYGIYLLVLHDAWVRPSGLLGSRLVSFLLGLLTVAAIAAHWNGLILLGVLPLYLYTVFRKSSDAWGSAVAVVLGIVTGFMPWLLLYGEESFRVLAAPLKVGVDNNVMAVYGQLGHGMLAIILAYLRKAADAFWLTYWWPLMNWPGSPYVVFGLLGLMASLMLAALGRLGGPRFRRIADLAPVNSTDLFFLTGLLAWAFALVLIRPVSSYQYASNVFFPTLLLAARGYALLWGAASFPLSRYPAYRRVAAAACLIAAAYTVSADLALKLPAPGNANRTYDAMRRTLQTLLDRREMIFTAVYAYPFIYDYQYRSNYSFGYTPERLFPERRREASNPNINLWHSPHELWTRIMTYSGDTTIAITHDSFDYFQTKFVDERVWREDYRRVATVFSPHDGGYFAVLYRKDVAARLFVRNGLRPNTISFDDGVLRVIYDPADELRSGITNVEWRNLSPADKRAAVTAYFDRHNWFERPPHDVGAIVSAIDAYFSQERWAKQFELADDLRTLEQAIEEVIYRHLMSVWGDEGTLR